MTTRMRIVGLSVVGCCSLLLSSLSGRFSQHTARDNALHPSPSPGFPQSAEMVQEPGSENVMWANAEIRNAQLEQQVSTLRNELRETRHQLEDVRNQYLRACLGQAVEQFETHLTLEMVSQFAGNWRVVYQNGHWRTLSIDEEGNARVLAASWHCKGLKFGLEMDRPTGKLISSSNDQNTTEVYEIRGGRLHVERWEEGNYPHKKPDNPGQATRVAQGDTSPPPR